MKADSNNKILIFIEWYKPGYKAGGPIRSISNLVDYLHDKAEIFIITSDTDYLETMTYPSIEVTKWQVVDNANVFYLSHQNKNYSTIKKLIKEVNPNIIYCNSLYSPYFTLIPLFLAKKLQIKPILATRGMLSSGALGVKSFKKKLFLSLAKFLGFFKNVVFHATSIDEQNDINKIFNFSPNSKVLQNFPNRINLNYNEKRKEVSQLNLVSVGRIAPEKNTLFALEILSHCKQKINFDIYGPIYNEVYWNKCEKIINLLPSNVSVNYKGVLAPKLLNNTLQNYHALLLPSTGENYGHIIIEAMMNSCIPIISSNTPWKELESKRIGYDINLNKPNEFTTKIDAVALMEQKKYAEMSQKAYIFAKKVIDDKDLVKKYINLFQL